MTARTLAVALVVGLVLTGCARPAPPPARVPTPVTVFTPGNRTGRALAVEGGTIVERWIGRTDLVTVGDVVAADLRTTLAARGVAVSPFDAVDDRAPGSVTAAVESARTAKLGGSALYVEISQWETDGATHPAYILVGLDAVLVDVASGERLWHAHRSPTPVATPGAVTLGSAYTIAAQKAVDELVAGWGPRQ